jgi:hypothetical protein
MQHTLNEYSTEARVNRFFQRFHWEAVGTAFLLPPRLFRAEMFPFHRRRGDHPHGEIDSNTLGRIMYVPEDKTDMFVDNPSYPILILLGIIGLTFGVLRYRSHVRERRSRPRIYYAERLRRNMNL